MNKIKIPILLLLLTVGVGAFGYFVGKHQGTEIIQERTKILPQALAPGMGVYLSGREIHIIQQIERTEVSSDGSFVLTVSVRPRTEDEDRLNGIGNPYGTYEERLRAVTNETIKYVKADVDAYQGLTISSSQIHD